MSFDEFKAMPRGSIQADGSTNTDGSTTTAPLDTAPCGDFGAEFANKCPQDRCEVKLNADGTFLKCDERDVVTTTTSTAPPAGSACYAYEAAIDLCPLDRCEKIGTACTDKPTTSASDPCAGNTSVACPTI